MGFVWSKDNKILWTEENDELNLLHLKSIKKKHAKEKKKEKNALQKALATSDKIRLSTNGIGNLKCASWLINIECPEASLSFPRKDIPRNSWQWFSNRSSHILLGPSLHLDMDNLHRMWTTCIRHSNFFTLWGITCPFRSNILSSPLTFQAAFH